MILIIIFLVFQQSRPYIWVYRDPRLVQCWATVYDVGPTLIQYWLNTSYWLRSTVTGWIKSNRRGICYMCHVR